ncbi:MAG: histidine kinase dimerization/phospho-acceptor domain-containing protein, partial [Ignavibacteria bacterium]|nr:histidine kinase dimerization/phospho-acceptor domain-containing protein [Ignavibacteria bacterium]
MDKIRRIISFFKLSDSEKEIYRNEIIPENNRRTLYLSLTAIPVSIIHIVLFALKLNYVSGLERNWVVGIIVSHMTILLVATICSILIYFFPFQNKENKIVSNVYINVILILLLVMGAVLTSIDQYVTSAITPFINTTLIAGLVFIIRPLYSTIYYVATYILFYFALGQTQLNQEILISNQVNGLTITAIGLCLSFILWRGNLARIKQSKQIIAQNKALVESNAEKDKFFSIIAHDLKSPFNSIIGFSDVLIDQIQEKNYDSIDKYAEIIQNSSTRAMDLLMNLMEWASSQTGRMNFNPEFFELDNLIMETELLFSGAVEQKSISIFKIAPSNAVVFA